MRLALISLVLAAVFVPAAFAEELPRHITVQGEGRVSATPDLAIIRAGVTTQALTASDAIEANSNAVRKVFSTLAQAGVGDADRQTSQFNVSPVYARPGPGQPSRRISGYQATNTVSVTVRDIGKLGGFLDALVVSGANQISGIQFGVADPATLQDQARSRAVADARRKAELYAKTLKVELGVPISLSESGTRTPGPRLFAAAEARSAVPIAPGEQEIAARVTVVYAIEE